MNAFPFLIAMEMIEKLILRKLIRLFMLQYLQASNQVDLSSCKRALRIQMKVKSRNLRKNVSEAIEILTELERGYHKGLSECQVEDLCAAMNNLGLGGGQGEKGQVLKTPDSAAKTPMILKIEVPKAKIKETNELKEPKVSMNNAMTPPKFKKAPIEVISKRVIKHPVKRKVTRINLMCNVDCGPFDNIFQPNRRASNGNEYR